jgi:hypothetical protein
MKPKYPLGMSWWQNFYVQYALLSRNILERIHFHPFYYLTWTSQNQTGVRWKLAQNNSFCNAQTKKKHRVLKNIVPK